MVRTLLLAIAAASIAALPAAADAKRGNKSHHGWNKHKSHHGWSRHEGRRGWHSRSYGRYYAPYASPYWGNGYYSDRYYGNRLYFGDRFYGDRFYGDRFYGDRFYGDRYYGRRWRRDRCGSGATGTILGAGVGALLGREIDRNSRRGYYGRGDGSTGLIVGGTVGALVGREIGRDC